LSAASASRCPRAHTQIAANISETQSFPLPCIVVISFFPSGLIEESFVHDPLAFVHHRLIDARRGHSY
jgi:hypothetical protein